jgi:hypothetical protein
MEELSNTYILLIRECKKSNPSVNVLCRIISKGYDIPLPYVDLSYINYHLCKIAVDYNLIRDFPAFLAFDCNPKNWGNQKSYMENFLDKIISVIACSNISKFPNYRRPLKTRVKH